MNLLVESGSVGLFGSSLLKLHLILVHLPSMSLYSLSSFSPLVVWIFDSFAETSCFIFMILHTLLVLVLVFCTSADVFEATKKKHY